MKLSKLFAILLISIGCDQSPVGNEILSGEWVNVENSQDRLTINDSMITRADTATLVPKHHYSYSLLDDQIELTYLGELYISVPTRSFEVIFIDENTIEIKGISDYFPKYKGDVFRKQSFYEP